jgi:hypothetical protein
MNLERFGCAIFEESTRIVLALDPIPEPVIVIHESPKQVHITN